MSNGQSVKAVAKYVRISPHKVRQVLDQIRGRSYQEALMILEFLPYDASSPIWQGAYKILKPTCHITVVVKSIS